MKILVTGATGFLGSCVLSVLSNNFGNENVFGTGRNILRIEELKAQNFNLIAGDLCDSDFVNNKLAGFTHIVHCAARSSQWGSYDSFFKDNVTTTLNLLNGIDSIERFIYISTPSIYFNFSDRFGVKEDDPLPRKFINHYAATKYIAEQEVVNYRKDHFIRIVIRPRAIVGAGDTVLIPRVLRAYKSGRLKIIGDGKNICDFSSVKNVAHAVCLALKAGDEVDGRIFNITDDNPLAIWPLMLGTLTRMGFNPDLKKISYGVVRLVASLNETFSRLFALGEPVLTKYGVGVLKYSITLDITEAKRILKYKPVITTEESLAEYIKEYKNGNK